VTNSAAHDNDHWEDALDGIGLTGTPTTHPTLSLIFANALYPDFEALAEEAYARSGAGVLIGCTGRGVVATGTEIEGRPALSILNLDLPGTTLFPRHLEGADYQGWSDPGAWHEGLGAGPDQVNAWLVLADPFTFDAEPFVAGLQAAYPGKVIAGGLASGLIYGSWTWLLLNDKPYSSGAVVLGIGGNVGLETLSAPGAIPIGKPGTATAADGGLIQTIDDRRALDVLRETIDSLDDDLRWQAQESMLMGVPSANGTAVIRNVVATDRRAGTVQISGRVRAGDRVQFHLADPDHADQALRQAIAGGRAGLSPRAIGALVTPSLNRGIELFHVPDHDATAIADGFGPLPVAGFLSTGEIAGDGQQALLHGATATMAFFVPR
jgi:small ligand-binding sensory domain FIST